MARAKAGSWLKLVAGLVVGAAPPLFTTVVPFAVSGSALLAAPQAERPLPVHEALNSAIELHRRGDYEASEEAFKTVYKRQDDLNDSEKQDLYRFSQANTLALQGRREGDRQLRLIDKALLENRVADANDLLKLVLPHEQYLTPADKAKYRALYSQLKGRAPEPTTPLAKPVEMPKPAPAAPVQQGAVKPLPESDPFQPKNNPAKPAGNLAEARNKLQQARAQLNQANIDLAEKLAKDTEKMGVAFPPAEDTPAKVLQDVARDRADAKKLLVAARAAMGRQEFDVADKYAKQSEAVAGTFTFPLWADSPSKVQKELKDLKETQAAKAAPPKPEPPKPQTAERGTLDSMKDFIGLGTKPEPTPAEQPKPATPTPATPPTPAAPVTTNSNKPAPTPVASEPTDKARILIRQARKALEEKKPVVAKQLAEQAKALKPHLETWEDTPEKLLADISRVESMGEQRTATTQPAKADAGKPAEKKQPTTKEDAVALVKTARTQLAEGKIDDAQMSAIKARAVKNLSWGLFEDSPDSALKDIEKARVKHNQEESVKVLAEGRKLLEKGDWEGAQRAAYRAQNLHGPYQFYDMGDRPDKLLAEAQDYRTKHPKPDTAVVKKDEKKPDTTAPVVKAPTPTPTPTQPAQPIQTVSTLPAAPQPVTDRKPDPVLPPITPPTTPKTTVAVPSLPPSGVPTRPDSIPAVSADAQERSHALQKLGEARQAIKVGEFAKAKLLADQVAAMKVTWLAGDDNPGLVYQEIERVTRTPSAPTYEPVVGMQPMQPAQPEIDATKAKAVQLLVEGRQLQKAGKFIEARQKCLEAVATQAVFGSDEDNPVTAGQQIAIMAKQRVDAIAAQATEIAYNGAGDPLARYQRAEQMLQEVHYLARSFGWDVSTLDEKLTWIHEQRAQAQGQPVKVVSLTQPAPDPVQMKPTPPALPPVQPVLPPVGDPVRAVNPPYQPPTVALPQAAPVLPAQPIQLQPTVANAKGHQLLDQARNELRAGALSQARKAAMEAMKEEFGVVEEASAVLRTIDTEEFNLKARADRRTFDAAVIAFKDGKYDQASFLIGEVNPHNLDEARQLRLREMIQTPGMMAMRQPATQVAKVDPTKNGGMDTLPNISGGTPGDPTAKVRVTDGPTTSPDVDILKETASMRNILFQKLRTDGLNAQNDAQRKFQAGDSDQALDVLKDYLQRLEGVTDLDASQLALLRKPVESRLKHFELMALQEDFRKQDKIASNRTMDNRNRRLAAEDAKQKKVVDLMKQCTELLKEHKFDDAYRVAVILKDYDPDNPAVESMFLMAQMQSRIKADKINKDNLEKYFLEAGQDEDRLGPYMTNDNPLTVNPERSLNAYNRQNLLQIIQKKNPKMIQMEQRLMTPVTVNYKDVTMHQAIEDLRATQKMNFDFDDASLQSAGISLERTVTLRLEGVMLKTAIELLLNKLNLSYIVKEDHIRITTKENAKGQLERRTYPVTDLIVPVDNSISDPGAPLPPGQQNTPSGMPTITTNGTAPTPLSGGNGYVVPGTSVGTAMGNTPQPVAESPEQMTMYGPVRQKKRMMQTRQDALIKLITNSIAPQSWSDMNGAGTIDYFPMAGALVINQTLDIQEQVADLLQALRRLQDQEVAIEVRLITVDEDYYERIGLDFSMNIATNQRNDKFVPSLLASAFSPQGQFNTAATGAANGLLGGITPAGTLTPDLSIPIHPNSFSPAAPTFGGYQGSGVGGLALGLAFLSDIQVSLFLEAVAGDARSSISQSPRVTLQNGQQATISITDNLENLVTGVQLVQLGNGGFTLVPQVQPINNQTTLSVSAVISADRRFVRLTPQLGVQNVSISNPAPAPTPILLPIYPTASTADPGNAVVFTQYIQQPQRISSIQLDTTVTVPDGGTVVMGGLKRMSEGRLEYGPPVLSKIPYINRLFRNVGYGRSGSSVLLMVTPRIIIQEEEEERATGFSIGRAVQ